MGNRLSKPGKRQHVHGGNKPGKMLTPHGQVTIDKTGLKHYRSQSGSDVGQAAEDAVGALPEGGGWFWFSGTFCPILPGDTSQALENRWWVWREKYEAGGLLSQLDAFSRIN